MANTSFSIIEQQAHDALRVLAELLSVEFKEAQPYDKLKYKIAKAVMAMANARDGGLIIIGVRQRQNVGFALDGVPDSVAETYDHETLYNFVARYASPPPEMTLFPTTFDGKQFIVISVKACERSPVICRCSSPDRGVSDKDRITVCEIYVRSGAPVRTHRVDSASMLDDLLQSAASRRAAEMIRALQAAGAFETSVRLQSRFDSEVADIAELI